MQPCSEKPPCLFPRGKSASIEVEFTPSDATDKLTANVYGYIAGQKVPFPLPGCTDPCNEEACKLKCPLVPETSNTYNVSIPVSSLYPPVCILRSFISVRIS